MSRRFSAPHLKKLDFFGMDDDEIDFPDMEDEDEEETSKNLKNYLHSIHLEAIQKSKSEKQPIEVKHPTPKATPLKELFTDIPHYSAPEGDLDFQRIQIVGGESCIDKEMSEVCAMINEALSMRKKYVYERDSEYWGGIDREEFERTMKDQSKNIVEGRRRAELPFDAFKGVKEVPGAIDARFEQVDGVFKVFSKDKNGDEKAMFDVASAEEFFQDYMRLINILNNGPVKTFTHLRMKLLKARFEMHRLLNQKKEIQAQKSVPHRDFYNVRKVDTHVHHSACMNQKHLLRFIKHKLKHTPNEVAIYRDGRFLTLSEVFTSLNLSAYDLSIDTLDMHADTTTFHRFDNFNLKYNPCGQSRLREIFLKTDNLGAGRFLAQVTKEVFSDLESQRYQLAEYRISVYGRQKSELDKLARWFFVNKLASRNIRWMIQIPRLYSIYKKSGQVENFQQMLDNIFEPLFEVSIDPSSNPPLHLFLNQLVGFDCVDDESKFEQERYNKQPPIPSEWNFKGNPPFSYWMYYINANICSLNKLRASRRLSTFTFRPHAGEAGDINHCASAFLTSEHINHGITMRKAPALLYLYYLAQVGIAMSPLSNNKLFLDYHQNPFFKYFQCGLNVSLSTDDPLLLHYTKEPLVEEYCVATQVWKLSSVDTCEIARNSVFQSGFEHPYKRQFLGSNYLKPAPNNNDICQTNVPDVRLIYRHQLLHDERTLIRRGVDHFQMSLKPGAISVPSPLLGSSVVRKSFRQEATEIQKRKRRDSLKGELFAHNDDEEAPALNGMNMLQVLQKHTQQMRL